jgi:hypothetical protein
MLDLDKYLERWFEKKVGNEKCRFLLRYYSPEKRIEHEKACTINLNKDESKRDDEKYVAMMVDWVIRDWEEVGGECNAENRKKFTIKYSPTVQELLETAQIEAAFRECNSIELVKNYVGLSVTPNNGEPQKAEINQD